MQMKKINWGNFRNWALNPWPSYLTKHNQSTRCPEAFLTWLTSTALIKKDLRPFRFQFRLRWWWDRNSFLEFDKIPEWRNVQGSVTSSFLCRHRYPKTENSWRGKREKEATFYDSKKFSIKKFRVQYSNANVSKTLRFVLLRQNRSSSEQIPPKAKLTQRMNIKQNVTNDLTC